MLHNVLSCVDEPGSTKGSLARTRHNTDVCHQEVDISNRLIVGRTPAPAKPHSSKDVLDRMGDRWNKFLTEGGCSDPDAVVKSFKRIIQSGAFQQ